MCQWSRKDPMIIYLKHSEKYIKIILRFVYTNQICYDLFDDYNDLIFLLKIAVEEELDKLFEKIKSILVVNAHNCVLLMDAGIKYEKIYLEFSRSILTYLRDNWVSISSSPDFINHNQTVEFIRKYLFPLISAQYSVLD